MAVAAFYSWYNGSGMKIEFKPDFTRPRFKAIWPRLRDFLAGFRFKSDRRAALARLVIVIALAAAAMALLLLVLGRS